MGTCVFLRRRIFRLVLVASMGSTILQSSEKKPGTCTMKILHARRWSAMMCHVTHEHLLDWCLTFLSCLCLHCLCLNIGYRWSDQEAFTFRV